MQRNIRLEIEYDGTNFSGWQVQSKRRTIQREIENRLEKILREKIVLIGAGRTDAGVHALGQVANFKTKSKLKIENILRGLNSLLPADIVIKNIKEVNEKFHARFSAKSRVYRYRIYSGRTALLRDFVWEVGYRLNLDKMKKATRKILGRHDFSSFCVAKSSKESNICKVLRADCRKKGNELVFEIEADRFLHSMVRALVGTIVDVGRGYFSISDFQNILLSKDRKKAGLTAPAKGLYLVKVKY
ncbi:MAG: tRNA pseudouridine(38-40) synthase TruA [candidate division Zixibacteria bacterium]|nr:tRNA pseudouridine(38-40) synthase TruA [candidate division Zixibacteria bacterium]